MIPPSVAAEQVAEARKRLGLSRRLMAERTKLSEGKVWRCETRGTDNVSEVAALWPVLLQAGVVTEPADGGAPDILSTPTAPNTAIDTWPPIVMLDVDSEVTWLDGDIVPIPLPQLVPERQLTPTELTRLDGVRRVSNSEIQTFKHCRRRWWLAWYRGLSLKTESPVGVRAIGDRVHRALRYWYVPDGEPRTNPRDALERLIVADWTELVRAHGTDGISAELAKAFNVDANLERAMVEGYVQWLQETGADAELRVIASETYVEADVPGTLWTNDGGPVRLVAKIDTRVTRTLDDVHLFIDHKTVGDLTRPKHTLHLDEQMLTYHLVEFLSSAEGDTRCDGALYNMLKRVKRTQRATPPFYERVEVRHNKHELESFQLRVAATIADIRDVTEALDVGGDHRFVVYPSPTADCSWRCQFFAVCGMLDDGSRAEDLLSTYYVTADPTAYYVDQSELSAGGAE